MIQGTVAKIEERLKQAAALPEEKRAELLALVRELRRELDTLPPAQQEQAASVAGFIDVSTYEATRATRNERLLTLSLQGVDSSVEEFEASHPRLAQVANAIATMLANIGV